MIISMEEVHKDRKTNLCLKIAFSLSLHNVFTDKADHTRGEQIN